ncbi:MAG: M28 family peptidase [Thermoleophilaceae bacterium]|nr:M28 family peptidase [Thermoleophilaceae bacterium]
MIEPRIYRAAFLPALLAVVIGMFSLESRPSPLPQGLAADVLFEGRLAASSARALAERFPDRRPGRPGDLAAARHVAQGLAAAGFDTRIDSFRAGGRALANVVARRVGSTRRQIVVMAPRDALGVPDAAGSAADTAALLEMARVLEGRAPRKTLVLASVDGSTLGSAGARRFLATDPDRRLIDGAIVLSNLGADRVRGPLVVGWGGDAKRAGIALQRTVSDSLRQELGSLPGAEGLPAQLIREAFPLGLGEQGPLLQRGVDAVRVSGSGELPPRADRPASAIDEQRLGALGRGVLRAVYALDEGRPLADGPHGYVTVVRKVLPAWAVSLIAFTLILPALVASVDAFARARRRRRGADRWWRWTLAGAAPFLAGLVLAELLGAFGAAPPVGSSPAPPQAYPLDGGALAQVLAVAGVVAAAWAFARVPLIRWLGAHGDPASEAAPTAPALLMCGVAIVVWLIDPYAALFLLPPLHLWMLATLGPADRRRIAPFALIVAGLVPLAVAALYYMRVLSLNPLEALWYLYLLVVGHHVGFASALAGCLTLGVLGSNLAVLAGRARRPEPKPVGERPRIRGPGGHAGPGSLGGTRSALRR